MHDQNVNTSAPRVAKSWRKRLAFWSKLVLFLILTGIALWLFAPYQLVISLCRVCGKEKRQMCVLSIPCFVEESDTDLSEWYCASGMQPHAHEWLFLAGTDRDWHGNYICYDNFGFEVSSLIRFREASSNLDRNTFEAFVKKYESSRNDPMKMHAFFEELEKNSPSSQSSENNSKMEN
jgi:hypothetical protein